MKILHVYRTYFPDPPGGMQEAIRQLCLSLKNLDVDNTVFTLSPKPYPCEIRFKEADVIREYSWASPASCDLGTPSSFRKFRSLAKAADVIHYFFPWPYADLLNIVLPDSKPTVITYVSDIVRQQLLGKIYQPLMNSTLRNANAIVANAPSYLRSSNVLNNKKYLNKTLVIPFGIKDNKYLSGVDDNIFARLRLQKHDPYFLFIGVLRYYKGLNFLIRAAEKINAKFIISGTGPEMVFLKKQVDEKKIDNVVFSGQVTESEKNSLLKYCRALILPSHLRSEAYGMVLIEAAIHSKPLISCEIGTGTSFINKNKETGFVVPPKNPEALSIAINALLENEELACSYGAAARKRYETMFTSEIMGRAYLNLFKSLIPK